MDGEEWRAVEAYPRYQVSDAGRVRRIEFTSTDSRGRRRTWPEMVLKQEVGWHGYCTVVLTNDAGPKRFRVHRIVAHAFLEKEHDEQSVVRHRNHKRTDNRAENLAWGTHQDNSDDAVRAGRTRGHLAMRTHCPRGHAYDRSTTRGDGGRIRYCSRCHRTQAREYARRKRWEGRKESA